MPYFLGADVGATKTQIIIADEGGRVVGAGRSGPGNHEVVGYDGLTRALMDAASQALAMAQLSIEQVGSAGFGVAGLDWPVELPATLDAIAPLGLSAPVTAVNDALIGLVAGSSNGWGLAVVSGTGCNCRGWDRSRTREGMVTGGGRLFGEAAGGGELVAQAIQIVAQSWTHRLPPTALSDALVHHAGARDVPDLLFGVMEGEIKLSAEAAPLIFEVACQGDALAQGLIHWAGRELGEMINAVTRQLEFERLEYDVIMIGSLFNGGPMLIESMQQTVHSFAPGARFSRLAAPPAVGAVLVAMEQVEISLTFLERRQALEQSVVPFL